MVNDILSALPPSPNRQETKLNSTKFISHQKDCRRIVFRIPLCSCVCSPWGIGGSPPGLSALIEHNVYTRRRRHKMVYIRSSLCQQWWHISFRKLLPTKLVFKPVFKWMHQYCGLEVNRANIQKSAVAQKPQELLQAPVVISISRRDFKILFYEIWRKQIKTKLKFLIPNAYKICN